MQGTLNEIDIRSILQLIKLGQRTGELLSEADQTSLGEASLLYSSATGKIDSPGIFWLVFFVNGEIVYATHSQNRGCRRLRDYLFRYQVDIVAEDLEKIQRISHHEIEYAYLWQLIKQNRLTPDQGKSIIQQMARETLFDLLSLRQGGFVFEMGLALDPLLISIEIEPLVREMMQEVQQWKQLHPYFESPQQALTIAAPQQLQNSLPQKAYEQLLHWADGKTSLRRLSRRLQRNLGTLARGLYPYVERGWLHPVMTISPSISKEKKPSIEGKTRNSPHIVCIDDDLSVSKTVESILKKNGYQISLITDPLPGLSLLFELKPDVILCDIAMPKLDGYEICAMLRHSKAFKYTPIMMRTGKEGFIDRIRARMVGATDYLTKPFGEQEFIVIDRKICHTKNEKSPSLENQKNFSVCLVVFSENLGKLSMYTWGKEVFFPQVYIPTESYQSPTIRLIFQILVSDLFMITKQSSISQTISKLAKSQVYRENIMRAVLLVEDSPAQQKMIANILKKNGWKVKIAEDGIKALEEIKDSSPDIIVLEIVMPKMNGYEVCRRIETNPSTQNVPIVMCSSKGEEFDRYWGMKQGADAYIAKPFEDVELIGTIQQLLR